MKSKTVNSEKKFTLKLAVFDAFPVLFFGISAILIGITLQSHMFIFGAVLCFFGGSTKVIWKLIMCYGKKSIHWLSVQLHYLMPMGILFIFAGIWLHRNDLEFTEIIQWAAEMPVIALLLFGVLCLILMGVFAFALDNTKTISHWIEEITNFAGQLSILIAVVLLVYSSGYYHADNTALQALASTKEVTVEVTEDRAVFIPDNTSDIGLIFYPGGKVEYTSYAPLLHSLAENGITCIVVRMPLFLAFFDTDSAERVMKDYPEIKNWYIAGHSLGGVAAAFYASENEDKIDGIIFLAAYSTKSLESTRVLSIYGSNDGILNSASYSDALENFPKDYTEIIINGGNHCQFGSYGFQNGDGEAEISQSEQIKITSDAIVDFINGNSN